MKLNRKDDLTSEDNNYDVNVQKKEVPDTMNGMKGRIGIKALFRC